MILQAKKICKSYKTAAEYIVVLDNLDLTVNSGEIAAVMGPSGAGKSTLLHILGLLDTFDSGSIEYDGHPIQNENDLASLRARKIGFIFQYHHLLPEFTVLENLVIPQHLINTDAGTARERSMELLESLGLGNRASHYPSQISGGEKQRVALLRSLVNQPKLVLADEPTGNLDLENSQNLLKLITKMRDDFGQSFLIATHDQVVAEVADRVLFLDSGKLKQN